VAIFRKSVKKIQVSLKSDENSEYFIGRSLYIYGNWLNYSWNEKCVRSYERKSKHILCIQDFFFLNLTICEIVWEHVACPSTTLFFQIISKTAWFKKFNEHKNVFDFCLQLLAKTLIQRRIEWDVKMYIGIHVKCLLFLSDFNKTLICSNKFSKNTQLQTVTKIRQEGAEFHADGQTDQTWI